MSQFTIRNKATHPIVTMRAAVFAKLLEGRPESVGLVLGKYRRDYKALTGKDVSLDHEQEQQLLARAGADSRGMWTSKYNKLPSPWFQVQHHFEAGFMTAGPCADLLENLAVAEAFYDLLDTVDAG